MKVSRTVREDLIVANVFLETMLLLSDLTNFTWIWNC